MNPSFELLDWLIIVIYAAGMMAVGWWYSRSKNADEYLLGGRAMKPWAVGISLFATLMSTLSYLAYPGEIIRHGPMYLSAILSYPLVFFVVGRFMIPYIMRLKVRSAYEILELRLGVSVRLLGSSIFLLLRLFWMALILFATADSVLVPLIGLDPALTPWVCVAMATVTVAYTSLGGLRAVVVTEVIQTMIMLVGAFLSLAIITYQLGGVSKWWPTHWSSSWDPPSFFLAPGARVSMGAAMLSSFIWYICTAGSDQMAIQRYLSTRNAGAARKVFGVSLLCDAGVALLLSALGLALYAFFTEHPELLPTGESLEKSADRLLPRFIVVVLPVGVSGLVVAGMLSAAMDSLSSGLNASALVIAEDWINRFRATPLSGAQQVRQVRWLCCVLGLAVIVISLVATYVPGNLLEMCFRVVNLLTAPLFVLFFMAMFVPAATAPATWIAAAASTSAAVGIAFFNLLGLSFLWIMPVSLLVGIVTGCLFSLVPIGKRRPMLETGT
jgi:SSS family solute:Na+ symporter